LNRNQERIIQRIVRTIFALFRGAALLVIFATASTLGITTASAAPAGASGGAGQATTTLQDRIRPGATGVWMFITRPSQFSQDPAEFYTSEIVAPV
jgi:hypothetical protein